MTDSISFPQSRPDIGRRVRRPMRGLSVAVLLTALAIPLPGANAGRPLTAPQPGGPTLDLDTITIPPFCAGPLQVQGVKAVVCEFPVNWVFDEADLAQFATSNWGVTIQAVGGNGGDALAGKSLYIYVGNNGSFGAPGNGGSGGAATVVATAPLSPTVDNLEPDVIVAAGGGGSSWASPAGQGITIPGTLRDWQPLPNNDPGQVVITVYCPGDACP